jgi:hypothetical protein
VRRACRAKELVVICDCVDGVTLRSPGSDREDRLLEERPFGEPKSPFDEPMVHLQEDSILASGTRATEVAPSRANRRSQKEATARPSGAIGADQRWSSTRATTCDAVQEALIERG